MQIACHVKKTSVPKSQNGKICSMTLSVDLIASKGKKNFKNAYKCLVSCATLRAINCTQHAAIIAACRHSNMLEYACNYCTYGTTALPQSLASLKQRAHDRELTVNTPAAWQAVWLAGWRSRSRRQAPRLDESFVSGITWRGSAIMQCARIALSVVKAILTKSRNVGIFTVGGLKLAFHVRHRHGHPRRLVRHAARFSSRGSSPGCPLGMRACTRVLYTIVHVYKITW